jgi:hypothetical protein
MKASINSIKTMEQLAEAVLLLESRQELEGKQLREQFMRSYESIQPANLVRSAISGVTESQELKDHLVSTGVGLVAGHVSKQAFESISDSPVKQLIGTAIQFGVTNVVARNPDVVMAVGKGLFRLIVNVVRHNRTNREPQSQTSD